MDKQSWKKRIADLNEFGGFGFTYGFVFLILFLVCAMLVEKHSTNMGPSEGRFIFVRDEKFGSHSVAIYRDGLSKSCWGRSVTSDSIFGPFPCE